MTSLEIEILELWDRSTKAIQERFNLQSPLKPQSIIVVNSSTNLRSGGYYDAESRKFFISKSVTSEKGLLAGVVFRESMIASLPVTLCVESRRDIGAEYASQLLNKKDKEAWIESWEKTPPIRLRANLEYNSCEMMRWIYALGGERQLDLLIHELSTMARYGNELDFKDYVDYMTRRSQNITTMLGHTELKILDALLKNQKATITELAELTSLSRSWVSSQINRLKRRYVLLEFTTTPFSRIGIRSFHVLLSGPPQDDVVRYISACPFLYNVMNVLNGPWQVMARLAIPDNQSSIRALERMESRLTNVGVAVDLSETHSAGVSHSFYHYNLGNSKWAIPWLAMQGWGQRIEEEFLDQVIQRIDTPSQTADKYLDETDMRILGHIHTGVSSTRALRRQLSIGQNQLSKRLKHLKSAELIQRVWNVRNIGLVERVALRTRDRRTGRILDLWSRELPHIILQYGERRDLLMIANLPVGGATKLMETLRTIGWNIIVSPLGSSVWGQWQFPHHLWDAERQRWQTPDKEIEYWRASIEQEIESPIHKYSKSRPIDSMAMRRPD